MSPGRARFRRLLAEDERGAFPFELISPAERGQRRLARPATNLGTGRGRFRIVFDRLVPLIREGDSLCDVGAYPGTALRIARTLPGGRKMRMTALGLGFPAAFRTAMKSLDVQLAEMEFDVRIPPSPDAHILTCPVQPLGGPFDICLCTEVIEHQVHPASLLIGLNRLTRPDGIVLVTTNSVSFVGDIARLALGRHNIETLQRSHVVSDSDWRPHIRLYTRSELQALLELAGFELIEARYFDNGNVYAGMKGAGMGALRLVAGRVPHLRSHILVLARRTGAPDPGFAEHLWNAIAAQGLARVLTPRRDDIAP